MVPGKEFGERIIGKIRTDDELFNVPSIVDTASQFRALAEIVYANLQFQPLR